MNNTEKYLVTGATGTTARYTIAALLEKGVQIRGLVHSLDDRSKKLSDMGVEVVQGDLLDFHAVNAAMKGITGVYYVYPILTPGILAGTSYAIQSACEHGVKNIVNMSQISARREAKSNAALDHWVAESMLNLSGITVTHIRPTFFAEWFTYSDTIKRLNQIILPFGNSRYAPIAAEDQGNVIANLLTSPEGHEGKVYSLFGKVEYDLFEMANIFTEELGRKITYKDITIAEYETVAKTAGYSDHFIQHITKVAQDCRDGVFSGTNANVRNITGHEPMDIRGFIQKHRAIF